MTGRDKSQASGNIEESKKSGEHVNGTVDRPPVPVVAYKYSHSTMEACGCILGGDDVGMYQYQYR